MAGLLLAATGLALAWLAAPGHSWASGGGQTIPTITPEGGVAGPALAAGPILPDGLATPQPGAAPAKRESELPFGCIAAAVGVCCLAAGYWLTRRPASPPV